MPDKPIPILLDINIWLRLISEDGKSPNLDRLFHLVQKGYLILLCPEALLEEWPRNRDKTRERHFDNLKPDRRAVNKLQVIKDPLADWSEERLLEFNNIYNQQLNCIDTLLANGKAIPRTTDLAQVIEDLKKAKRAPFHKSTIKNNTNDAELVYYSLEYVKKSGFNELFLVSDNSSEFAIKKGSSSLHPDIANYNPAITIHYHIDIGNTYHAFDALGLPDTPSGESLEFKKVKNTILVNRLAPLADQVLEYFEKRLGETSFLPKELFGEHYPFITEDFFDSHPRPFTLNVDNRALYDLLAPPAGGSIIKTTPSPSTDEETKNKLSRIKQHLFDLNIYRISYKLKDEVRLDNDPTAGARSNTYLFKYRVHDFLGILEELAVPDATSLTGDIKTDLQKAYTFYKLAHFRGAAAILLKIKNTYKGQRSIPYYICCFNLTRIAQLVRNSYWGDITAQELAKECLRPELNKEKASISLPQHQDILNYIHRTQFFSENFFELQTALNSIRDYYLRQTSGFNKEAEKLLEHYFSTETFLHENCIVFDRYNEFNALTAQYIEGMFASYGCDDTMGGKINIFNDDHLIPIILYGQPDEINNHFERYKITNLKYHSDILASSVYTLVCNILTQYLAIKTKFDDTIKKDIPEFFHQYIRRLSNCLLIMSVLDLEKELLENIARKLVPFLIVQTDVPNGLFTKWARQFLLRNEQKLSPTFWQEYFLAMLRHKPLHEGMNFSLMAHVCAKKHIFPEIPDAEFKNIIQNFIDKCNLCNDEHTWHDLADIYRSMGNEQQKECIREMVLTSLAHRFDEKNYCMAVVSDIIPADNASTQQCVDIVAGLIETNMKPRLYNGRDYFTDGRLDQLINMCWKLGIDIPVPIQAALPLLGPYYTWIVDLEAFNYSTFNPEWLHHSFTMYYKREFRKSKSLKKHLLDEILKGNYQDHTGIYIRIFDEND